MHRKHVFIERIREADYRALQQEIKERGDYETHPEEKEKLIRKAESLLISYTSEFWFDINGFF